MKLVRLYDELNIKQYLQGQHFNIQLISPAFNDSYVLAVEVESKSKKISPDNSFKKAVKIVLLDKHHKLIQEVYCQKYAEEIRMLNDLYILFYFRINEDEDNIDSFEILNLQTFQFKVLDHPFFEKDARHRRKKKEFIGNLFVFPEEDAIGLYQKSDWQWKLTFYSFKDVENINQLENIQIFSGKLEGGQYILEQSSSKIFWHLRIEDLNFIFFEYFDVKTKKFSRFQIQKVYQGRNYQQISNLNICVEIKEGLILLGMDCRIFNGKYFQSQRVSRLLDLSNSSSQIKTIRDWSEQQNIFEVYEDVKLKLIQAQRRNMCGKPNVFKNEVIISHHLMESLKQKLKSKSSGDFRFLYPFQAMQYNSSFQAIEQYSFRTSNIQIFEFFEMRDAYMHMLLFMDQELDDDLLLDCINLLIE